MEGLEGVHLEESVVDIFSVVDDVAEPVLSDSAAIEQARARPGDDHTDHSTKPDASEHMRVPVYSFK
eukprot:12147111-Alexandrium_andersonii.AAC.1